MRSFHGQAGRRYKAHAAATPYGFRDHTAEADATVELVYVSPETFLKLERGRKRRKNKISLAPVKFKGL